MLTSVNCIIFSYLLVPSKHKKSSLYLYKKITNVLFRPTIRDLRKFTKELIHSYPFSLLRDVRNDMFSRTSQSETHFKRLAGDLQRRYYAHAAPFYCSPPLPTERRRSVREVSLFCDIFCCGNLECEMFCRIFLLVVIT